MNDTSINETAAVDSAVFGQVINPIMTNIVSPLIVLAFAVAVVVFAYGVIQMIIQETDAAARTKGKMAMLGGLIGLLIMGSAWGIIQVVSNTVKQFGN